MVGHAALDRGIGVRIPASQPLKCSEAAGVPAGRGYVQRHSSRDSNPRERGGARQEVSSPRSARSALRIPASQPHQALRSGRPLCRFNRRPQPRRVPQAAKGCRVRPSQGPRPTVGGPCPPFEGAPDLQGVESGRELMNSRSLALLGRGQSPVLGSLSLWLGRDDHVVAATLAVGGLSVAPALSQDAEPSGLFTQSVEVRVINIDVFATDRKGRPVTDLVRIERANLHDFVLMVDGQPTEVEYFYTFQPEATAEARAAGGQGSAALSQGSGSSGSRRRGCETLAVGGRSPLRDLHRQLLADTGREGACPR